ncbi:hypothetical protein DFH08DRAFT_849514 [Mycena albidolilacea]|uniref:Uncharacterized protein n=1 Tax=Mycena albidolilacea TaxID=1033008 RepID=A0AAD7AEF9_9AGAR|nr:hypothetical protein DFH08DRAFT_849514 [Mycena albidolilacea]
MAPAQPSRAYNLLLLTSTFLASKRHAIHAQISDWKPVLNRWAHSPIFQSRAFTALWQICQFLASSLLYGSHIIVSVGVFKYTHRRVKEFLSSYLPGSWGPPYFPIYRNIFIYLLVTLPLWGLAMTIFTASWFAATQLWSCLQRWRHRRNYYRLGTDMDLDLQPLNEEEDEPRSVSFPRDSKRASSRSGWAIFRAILWLLLYTSYLALALSGVYLLKTYELPGDHRYRGDVEKAIASPRREGYGSGGELFD